MSRIISLIAALILLCCGCYEVPPNSAEVNEKDETDNMTISIAAEEKLYLTINGTEISATFEENSSVDALKEKLSEGNITIKAKEYGGFEKVGSLGFSLPKNDTQYSTDFGDIMLYQGNQITLFYEPNSWSYTNSCLSG